ncbi:S-layer protein [Aureimonas sp. Leaf460]|nr:S-layer protein [Aureimonas sp. Leaf427]KQT76263.1 S-layer protein [Aureimonas sp. Leaf460]
MQRSEAGPMTKTLGWDVGGAHLKAALCEGGEIVKVWQEPTPLWKGLDHLDASLESILTKAGPVERHAVTMTGELTDIFPHRKAGVEALSKILTGRLGETLRFHAGDKGFVAAESIPDQWDRVASANWHASAALVAARIEEALFLDMGSTTTDIVPVKDGKVAFGGFTDAERLGAGELVYQGYTRTALMSVASHVPNEGRVTPIMAEFFATMADVQRILGVLDESDDQHPTADGQAKTAEASRARLARMIGRDAFDAAPGTLERTAEAFAEAQIRRIHDAALLVSSRGTLSEDAPVVIAGAGRPVLRRLAARLDRGVVDFADLVECRSSLRDDVCRAAPAVALALLGAAA